MDFDSKLVQFQGALMKANNFCPFKSLTYKGGNEKKYCDTIQILREALVKKGYLLPNEICMEYKNELRHINLFIILNSELEILDKLVQNDDIGHLIWITPMINKSLLVSMVWELHLEEFYCETIIYANPYMSIELLQIANTFLKFTEPLQRIKNTKKIITSAYKLTKRLTYFEMDEKSLNKILKLLHDSIYEFCKVFSNIENTQQNYMYSGEVLMNIFELLIDCFSVFLNPAGVKLDMNILEIDLKLYSYTYDNLVLKKCGNMNNAIEEQLTKYNDFLINIAKTNLLNVNIDMYCSWSEFNLTNNKNQTYQNVIGELAYKLHNIMQSSNHFRDEIAFMLEPISCKPKELSDIIKEADRDTFLKNCAENMPNQKEWLETLIEKDFFLTDIECINCVSSNIALLSNEIHYKLFTLTCDYIYAQSYFDTQCVSSNCDQIKSLIFLCFSYLNISVKKELISTYFKDKEIDKCLELPNYSQAFIKFVNKTVCGDEHSIFSAFIDLFIQNPEKFYTMIFDFFLTHYTPLPLWDILNDFKEFYNLKYKSGVSICSMITNVMKNVVNNCLEKKETNNLPQFFAYLYKNSIISRDVILDYLMIGISNNSRNFDSQCDVVWSKRKELEIYFNCLNETFNPENHPNVVPPMLFYFAKIMEWIRWDVKTYSDVAKNILRLLILVQSKALLFFIKSKATKDAEWIWLKDNLIKTVINPINLVHYNELIPEERIVLVDFQSNAHEILMCLCYILPRCIEDECKSICKDLMNNLNSFITIITLCSVMKIICSEIIKSNSKHDCLISCGENLAHALKEIDIVEIDDENMDIGNALVDFINHIPEDFRDHFPIVFNFFLNFIFQSVKNRKDLCSFVKNNILDDRKYCFEEFIHSLQ